MDGFFLELRGGFLGCLFHTAATPHTGLGVGDVHDVFPVRFHLSPSLVGLAGRIERHVGWGHRSMVFRSRALEGYNLSASAPRSNQLVAARKASMQSDHA